jgi:energy-coupling factor transport system ATP-binding protein
MILGNWLFSPSINHLKYFALNINQVGLLNGVKGALKRDSMILISFAWLGTIGGLNDIYDALNIIKPFNRTLIIFLKWLQNIKNDFVYYYYSLQIRSSHSKGNYLIKKLSIMKYLMLGSFYRFFDNIGSMTYAGESHFKSESKLVIDNIMISNIFIKYKLSGEYVLQNISINISKGEFIYLSGDDKSGKSTLLKVLAAYIPKIEGYIMDGSIKYNNIDIDDIELKNLTLLVRYFNNYSDQLFLGLTVGQELTLLNQNEIVCQDALNQVGLTSFWFRDINTLSGGEKVRLLFATILVSDPAYILFDCPLSQLDPPSRSVFVDLLRKLRNQGKTIVVADNYINYYLEFITREVKLNKGFIETILTRKEIINYYLPPYDIIIPNNIDPNNSIEDCMMIDIKDAILEIDQKIILNNINIRINSGDFIAIVGPNGGGKTSLLFLIAEIYKPTNKAIKHYENCKIGFIFQNSRNQIIGETVKEELLIGPSLNKWNESRKAEYINNSMAYFHISLDKSTLELHPSDIKKLTTASMNFDANLIMFDEPTLDIDNRNKQAILKFIFDAINNKKAVIVVTHDLEFIKYATKFIYIEKGEITYETNDHLKINDYFKDNYPSFNEYIRNN